MPTLCLGYEIKTVDVEVDGTQTVDVDGTEAVDQTYNEVSIEMDLVDMENDKQTQTSVVTSEIETQTDRRHNHWDVDGYCFFIRGTNQNVRRDVDYS